MVANGEVVESPNKVIVYENDDDHAEVLFTYTDPMKTGMYFHFFFLLYYFHLNKGFIYISDGGCQADDGKHRSTEGRHRSAEGRHRSTEEGI